MKEEVRKLFETTDLTQDEIGEKVGVTRKVIWRMLTRMFSPEEMKERKRKVYRKSKLGDRNPATGKHPGNYIGECSDGKGYTLVPKPKWYTGRKGTLHIFKHHLVICEKLGLTEIPRGMIVHHIDENPSNNDISNLILLTASAHIKLHQKERATTISKESTS